MPSNISNAYADQFIERPHRTFAILSFPVLISLIAEPLTGIVDTAFIASLGSLDLAALGAATIVLSGILWTFNFLSIGTQTAVAQQMGRNNQLATHSLLGNALWLALLLGTLLAAATQPFVPSIANWMGAKAELADAMTQYLRIRLFGAPAITLTLACFGAFRGVSDMRTPLWIAVGSNLLNIILDACWIFGLGPFPAWELAGAAWASTVSHWLGALTAIFIVNKRIGINWRWRSREIKLLLNAGQALMLRTGLLLAFLLVATRRATEAGVDSGAAHQALRQIWMFAAFLLDAYAASAQSLLAYFIAAGRNAQARRVVHVALQWGIASGVLLTLSMIQAQQQIEKLLVPQSALLLFREAWWLMCLSQPINAISFVSDGILWGRADYPYLRNVMLLASGSGMIAIIFFIQSDLYALWNIWFITVYWISVRALLGLVRSYRTIGV